ncbi:MAG: DUF58 domain-containing protein [Frankia sp.]|nr:DUF58 domain-containing protein [Frankia sp.]
MALSAALLAAATALLGYGELAALAAAAATATLAAVAGVGRRPRLRATLRVVPTRVARDEPAALLLTIHNPGRRRSRPVRLEVPWARIGAGAAVGTPAGATDGSGDAGQAGGTDGAGRGGGGGAGGAAAAVESGVIVLDVRRIAGGAEREIEISLDTSRRGVVAFDTVVLRRADPFGLVVTTTRLAAGGVLRVRPRFQPVGAPPPAPARDPDGRTADGAPGGVIFHGIREYVGGEDLRFVHWPSSARTGTLMVREHVEPSEPAATVVLDARPDAYPPGAAGAAAFEEAVDITASVVLGCVRESLGVVLLTTSGARRAGRGRAPDTEALLDDLAGVALDPAGTLELLGTLGRGGVGTLVLVTGGFEAGQLRAVASVTHRFGRVVVVRAGPRSMAAARAWARRSLGDRPRLRRAAAQPDAAVLLGRFEAIGRPVPVAARVAGRLRVLDVPAAAALPEAWPAGGRARAAGLRTNARAGYFGGHG